MQKIAVLSDVHGNLPALQAVLEDVAKRAVDQIYCLGDLVDFGPWPNEVIKRIQSARIPCLLGNHDERAAFDQPIFRLAKHNDEEAAARLLAMNHTSQNLTAESRDYLAALTGQFTLELNIAGRPVKVLLVHGSTRSNDEYIYQEHPEADLNAMLDGASADVLIMGHTHLPYIRRVSGSRLVLNCGSVGRSREEIPYATYLLLTVGNEELQPEIIRIPYPVVETIAAIEKSGIPDFYATFFKKTKLI